ncbi:MAG: hypothetical protein IJO29_07450 [Oscillospiraceae bacterium]|nr:hypothetical protein [Oscillospiraceae bacterium]
MAFVNAYLTEEEKRMFEEAKIPDPRYNLAKIFLAPNKWTIDREKNIALIYCGVANRDEYYKECFVLICDRIGSENIISLTLKRISIEFQKQRKMQQIYNVDYVQSWDIINIDVPYSLKERFPNEALYHILEEVLTIYGIDGKPEHNRNIKVFLVHEK